MASGHASRINRPNTWLLRPDLRREKSPCQHGAVHTWHIASSANLSMSDLRPRSGHAVRQFSRTRPYANDRRLPAFINALMPRTSLLGPKRASTRAWQTVDPFSPSAERAGCTAAFA